MPWRWRDGPLLGLDFETTGLDPHRDLPVQVALVWTMPLSVVTPECFLIDPCQAIPEEAVAIHGITTERARAEGRPLSEAAARVHSALCRALAEGVPVVAMNASFDVTIAEELFASFSLPSLRWDAVLDPLVLDRHLVPQRRGTRCLEALCGYYGVRAGPPHDARADAEAAVALTRQIGTYYAGCGDLDAVELTARQADWHRNWAAEQDAWCRGQGYPGLEPEEFVWPVRASRHLVGAGGS